MIVANPRSIVLLVNGFKFVLEVISLFHIHGVVTLMEDFSYVYSPKRQQITQTQCTLIIVILSYRATIIVICGSRELTANRENLVSMLQKVKMAYTN